MTPFEQAEALFALEALKAVGLRIPLLAPFIGIGFDSMIDVVKSGAENPAEILSKARDNLNTTVLNAMQEKFPNG